MDEKTFQQLVLEKLDSIISTLEHVQKEHTTEDDIAWLNRIADGLEATAKELCRSTHHA